jgi:periplasmic divalent cation tolerance protein
VVEPLEKYAVILVTASSKKEAENIAQKLLEEKLIACANIVGPVSSHFHWEGKVEVEEEFLLLLKSRLDLFDVVAERVRALHSYEVPEILALPVVASSLGYLDWMRSNLKT